MTTLRERTSPSGKLASRLLAILGMNTIVASLTRWMPIGTVGAGETAESHAQVLINEAGMLESLTITLIVNGITPSAPTTLDNTTYSVNINTVPIPGASGVLNNLAGLGASVVIPLSSLAIVAGVSVAAVKPGDLVDVQVVTQAFTGTSPVVRAQLAWTPGKSVV